MTWHRANNSMQKAHTVGPYLIARNGRLQLPGYCRFFRQRLGAPVLLRPLHASMCHT